MKVMPIDYKRAMQELKKLQEKEHDEARRAEVKVHG